MCTQTITSINLLLDAYRNLLEQAVKCSERELACFELPEGLKRRIYEIKSKDNKSADMRLHHLGFACEHIDSGLEHIKRHYVVRSVSEVIYDDLQRAELCFVKTENGLNIELVSGPKVASLCQRGIKIYHVGYEVADISSAIDKFKNDGAIVVSEAKPARLFDNRRVAFLETSLGLIELVEQNLYDIEESGLKESGLSENASETIQIAATFTAEPLQDSLRFWLEELGISANVKFMPYNQVFQQLLDSTSQLYKNKLGLNVVLIRLEDWLGKGNSALRESVDNFIGAMSTAVKESPVPYLVALCSLSPSIDAEQKRFYQDLENHLYLSLDHEDGIYVVTDSELSEKYPVENYYDQLSERLGHVPYTADYFTALGTMIIRKYCAMNRNPYKVIVLDCDNTLWGGVCGELGPDGIVISQPYQHLQEIIVSQSDTGMIIALCSKNRDEDVLNVFRHHEMPLRLNHITSRRINWSPKSDNLKSLASELNVGLDSFIFIDDDLVECAEVQINCPEVLTLQLPKEPREIPGFLDHIWELDHIKVTQEDKRRSQLYKDHTKRENVRHEIATLDEFIKNLQLNVKILKLDRSQLNRASQLTQRTNQFNFTTIRRQETELLNLYKSDEYECYVVDVNDRFGDYGLVGLMILKVGDKVIYLDTFLLSCRALGRRIEYQMIAKVGDIAKIKGFDYIDVLYRPTERNQPAFDFLKSIEGQYMIRNDDEICFRFPAKYLSEITYSTQNSTLCLR